MNLQDLQNVVTSLQQLVRRHTHDGYETEKLPASSIISSGVSSPSASRSSSLSPSASISASTSPSNSSSASPSLSTSASISPSSSSSPSVATSTSPSSSVSMSISPSASVSDSPSPSPTITGNSISAVLGETIPTNAAVMIASGNYVSNTITQNVSNNGINIYGNNWYGQTFQTSSNTSRLLGLKLKLQKIGTPGSVIHVFVFETSSGLPIGTSLIDVLISPSTINNWSDEYTINFSSPVTVSASTTYAFVIAFGNASDTDNVKVYYQDSNVYANGNFISSPTAGSTWLGDSNKDLYFKILENSHVTGRIYKASSEDSELSDNFIGFLESGGDSGDVKNVITNGLVSGFTGLVTGDIYYLSTGGQISTTKAYPHSIGIATSTIDLLITLPLIETFIANASENLKTSADTERTAAYNGYQKIKEIQVYLSGTYRVKFDLRASGSGFSSGARLEVNDVSLELGGNENDGGDYVTYTNDVILNAGDKIQVYAHGAGTSGPPASTAYVRNFRLYYDKILNSGDNIITN